MVEEIKSEEQFQKFLKDHAIVFVDFTATWCGPCKAIGPYFVEFAGKYKDKAAFCKVDVDELEDIAAKYEVSAMPTFICIKADEVTAKVVGANQNALEEMIQKCIN